MEVVTAQPRRSGPATPSNARAKIGSPIQTASQSSVRLLVETDLVSAASVICHSYNLYFYSVYKHYQLYASEIARAHGLAERRKPTATKLKLTPDFRRPICFECRYT
jgi:hypothetical protein